MDFKVAGTKNGITAVQMDNKLGSLSDEILTSALKQAKKSRLHILEEMKKILSGPRPELSKYCPRVKRIRIRQNRIRDLIGPGGRNIQEIQETYKVKINIQPNSGQVTIYAADKDTLSSTMEKINYLTGEPKVGKYYYGTVTSIKNFGAFVELFNNVDGLVHISELDTKRVNKVTDYVEEGDRIVVRVLGVDKNGKLKLSRKEALNVEEIQISN